MDIRDGTGDEGRGSAFARWVDAVIGNIHCFRIRSGYRACDDAGHGCVTIWPDREAGAEIRIVGGGIDHAQVVRIDEQQIIVTELIDNLPEWSVILPCTRLYGAPSPASLSERKARSCGSRC